jgi:hypothetical protein
MGFFLLLVLSAGIAAERKLGKAPDLQTVTKIKDLLGNPDKYLGQDVKIEGEIIKVCPYAGCWMLVKDDSSAEAIMVKVDEGVIVFPQDGVGRKVVAQGKFQKVEGMDEAQEESGFRSNYRIKGTGAVIQ